MTIHPKPTRMLLILGAGWTSTFLIPQLRAAAIPYAATSRTGRDLTIQFTFDPSSDDPTPFSALPPAHVVLITFPLTGLGPSKLLTTLYAATHPSSNPSYIQLGSTGIFTAPHWNTCNSPHDLSSPRAIAEDELLSLGDSCVLNLAGLYGGSRNPRSWLPRVATSKAQVRAKKALHLVHGEDVAAAVVALYGRFTPGKRWLLTDLHVYDWWDLFVEWGSSDEAVVEKSEEKKLPYRKWVGECMEEEGVRALPRDTSSLGRVLDSRDFWKEMGVWPSVGRVH